MMLNKHESSPVTRMYLDQVVDLVRFQGGGSQCAHPQGAPSLASPAAAQHAEFRRCWFSALRYGIELAFQHPFACVVNISPPT